MKLQQQRNEMNQIIVRIPVCSLIFLLAYPKPRPIEKDIVLLLEMELLGHRTSRGN